VAEAQQAIDEGRSQCRHGVVVPHARPHPACSHLPPSLFLQRPSPRTCKCAPWRLRCAWI
jgi:hypothetical protein